MSLRGRSGCGRSEPALGSATRAPSILDERAAYGGPRFYPSGEHPATYRLRKHRDLLAEQLDKVAAVLITTNPDAYRQGCEALADCERKITEFEAGELEAKRYAWARRDFWATRRGERDPFLLRHA